MLQLEFALVQMLHRSDGETFLVLKLRIRMFLRYAKIRNNSHFFQNKFLSIY